MNGACSGSLRSPNEKHAQVRHAFWPLQALRMTQHQGAQEEGDSPFNTVTSHRHQHPPHQRRREFEVRANKCHPSQNLGPVGRLRQSMLYAEPHSMAKHFNAMMLGARAIGQLPNRGHCKDSEALARVYEDEARQACQKILCCLDIRVLDGDLIVLTCLWMPTLILPTGHFMQLYYNPDAQGRLCPHSSPVVAKASCSPEETFDKSIIPRGFRVLPDDIREVVDAYFHRQELEDKDG